MENNQQRSGERNASRNQGSAVENVRPGQQLPSTGNNEKTSEERSAKNEEHSESSFPEKENETLGTP